MKHVSNEEKAKELCDCDNCKACSKFAEEGATYALTSTCDSFDVLMQVMEWKDEIMEKTLESSVSAEVGYFNQQGLSIYFDKSLEKLGFEEGDKVKVLIVKEE